MYPVVCVTVQRQSSSMKHRRMFKRQKERHPVKWIAISLGLIFLSFASFGAGVQFATLTLDEPGSQVADAEPGSAFKASAVRPLRAAPRPGKDT